MINRMDRIIAFQPDIHVVVGIHNDYSGYTSAARIQAVSDYITKFNQNLPDKDLVITGPKVLWGDTVAPMLQLEADIQAGILASGATNVTFIPTVSYALGDVANNSGLWFGGFVNGKYFFKNAGFTDPHPLTPESTMFNNYLAANLRAIFG